LSQASLASLVQYSWVRGRANPRVEHLPQAYLREEHLKGTPLWKAIRLDLKVLLRANALAYFASRTMTKKKSFAILTKMLKNLFFVTDEEAK
jgi:hypothetical protein